jgi:hypothetical protein
LNIEERPARGKRKNAFPQNRAELIAATVDRFHEEGHSVLLYCPMRKSVEPTAEAFLKLVKQGYIDPYAADGANEAIETALRIGEEWLGEDHVAMRALKLGIAVHHAQLPRPFLGEVERLLRDRVLSVAIASPTLAQGVDLSFGVLVFTSLWRNQALLPPKEFANVIGRVGRAFVDLDGIFVLPVFENDRSTRTRRLQEFHHLVQAARGRELESGLYLLIHVCLERLKVTLGVHGDALEQYVLNQQSGIDKLTEGNDDNAEQMELILAELDAGILALVDDLDCDITTLASNLDQALEHSLWRRRLAIRDFEEQRHQVAMLHARARHIWGRTSLQERRGFFAASIGTESGRLIVDQKEDLGQLLQQATNAVKSGNVNEVVSGCIELAAILFGIHPFRPKVPNEWDDSTWKAILAVWISGGSLSQVLDSAGIAFVQEALVYRLVWAIEAVRLVLSSLENRESDVENDDERCYVAICMTYGVPQLAAARLLESGLESRLLAVRLTRELSLDFTTRDGLLSWLELVRESEPIAFSDAERVAWTRFVRRNDFSYQAWNREEWSVMYHATEGTEVRIGEGVRLIRGIDGRTEIYTADFELIGTSDVELPKDRRLVGIVADGGQISVSTFGPVAFPSWMRESLDER